MKVKTSVKLRCSSCYFTKRQGVLRVYCINGKHKERQGKSSRTNVKKTKKAR